MKSAEEYAQLDAVAEAEDQIQVEIQKSVARADLLTLYVHVNGVTVLRICHLNHEQILPSNSFTIERLSP